MPTRRIDDEVSDLVLAGEVSVVDDVRNNGIVSSDRGTAVHIVLQRSRSTGSMGNPISKVFRCPNVLARCNPLIAALGQFLGESFERMDHRCYCAVARYVMAV